MGMMIHRHNTIGSGNAKNIPEPKKVDEEIKDVVKAIKPKK